MMGSQTLYWPIGEAQIAVKPSTQATAGVEEFG
jgi:hypothetical protein